MLRNANWLGDDHGVAFWAEVAAEVLDALIAIPGSSHEA